MEEDAADPWSWTVDRVVQEFCTSNRTWQPTTQTQSTPDPVLLETFLREEEVTGSVLLVDVDDSVLRNDFQIKKLGQRSFILRGIEGLRLRSPTYQLHRLRTQSSSHSPSVQQSAYHGASYGLQQTQQAPIFANLRFTDGTQAYSAPERRPSIIQQPSLFHGQDISASPPAGNRAESLDFIFTNATESKRRKLDVLGNNSLVIAEEEDPIFHQDDGTLEAGVIQQQDGFPTEREAGLVSEDSGKKRKRIAPTLVSSTIDPSRNREIPTNADHVIENDPHNIEPGVPFTGDDGRKRVVPILQYPVDLEEPYDYTNLLWSSNTNREPLVNASDQNSETTEDILEKKANISCERLSNGYLGKKKMPIDNIFYSRVETGQILPSIEIERDFFQNPEDISSGRRLYVHRAMKYFLRAERQTVLRSEKMFSAIRPYPVELAPKFHNPSFTLFYLDEDGTIAAQRESLAAWPEIDPEAVQQQNNGEKNEVSFAVGFSDLSRSYGDDYDPDRLEKYRHIPGGDEVLPLYGESDEENEYDLDTWREIEEERGTLEKPERPMKKPLLNFNEINKAIDESIEEIVNKWRKEKLPKKLRKAYRIWKKHRNGFSRKLRIDFIQKQLDHLNHNRIPKLRNEIASEIWTSHHQVRKQSQIMETSIYDRENLGWELSVIRSKAAPEKNLSKPLPPKKSIASNDNAEEGETIASDTEVSSSDGELGDFIVDENIGTADEIELNLADSEDEAADADSVEGGYMTDSDGSMHGTPKGAFAAKTDRSTMAGLMPDVLSSPGRDLNALRDQSSSVGSLSKDNTYISSPKRKPRPSEHPGSTSEKRSGPTPMVDLTMTASDDSITQNKKITLKIKSNSRASNDPIIISSGEENPTPDEDNLPPYSDPGAIAKYDYPRWTEIGDRARLLIAVIQRMNPRQRKKIISFISDLFEDDVWSGIYEVNKAYLTGRTAVKGMDIDTFDTLAEYLKLFWIFYHCKFIKANYKKNAYELVEDAHKAQFHGFFQLCSNFERYFDTSMFAPTTPRAPHKSEVEEEEDDDEPRSAIKRVRAMNTTSDEDVNLEEPSPSKKRKKLIENVEARDMRERDRQRLADQELRRQELRSKIANSGQSFSQHDSIIINESKLDDEEIIHINEQIGRRIKPHQIDGVRFMWNQIISGEQGQGCLLAHTMGLGKTMQVITLLVAIAEASRSMNDTIFKQIPERLRVSKTLVLCPPGLIDNWLDELLLWVPQGVLGDFRKVDSTVKKRERLPIISDWYHSGGVLILGYEMFKSFIHNRRTEKKELPALSQTDHEQAKEHLLNGPNIIIADEAHKMKNAAAQVTLAAQQFRSKSRIALTGSPLANNVEEYHTMINWVAPNYLGPVREFRQKYVEPIQTGLYTDSGHAARRKAMKMLEVLKEDVAPKVHRAGMSVLSKDLPPKQEFVITVPLTELQRKAYSLYVQQMSKTNHATTKDGRVAQSTIWTWLAFLSLLCNHPSCFNTKLEELKRGSRKVSNEKVSEMDDSGKDDLDWGVGVSSELYTSISPLLNDESLNLDAIDLSNKAKILFQILDASKAVGEKVLVFSQQLQTLNFLETLCKAQDRKYSRLDGKSAMSKRQMRAKDFNINDHEVYLISTNAGGLGLNLPGANRVVIFDFKFNPIQEEQAVGRAYRLGQDKPVYVYRLIAGGTFETFVHNKAVFKEQLASRVVDKKNPIARATRGFSEYLFEPRRVEQQDLSEFKNMDPDVLDKILESQETSATIRSIVQSDTFEKEDEAKLTPEELKEVKQDIEDERLKRSDPVAYRALLQNRTRALYPPPPMAANQRHLVQGYGSPGMQYGAMPQGIRSGVIGPSAVGLPSATNGRQGPQGSVNDLRVGSEAQYRMIVDKGKAALEAAPRENGSPARASQTPTNSHPQSSSPRSINKSAERLGIHPKFRQSILAALEKTTNHESANKLSHRIMRALIMRIGNLEIFKPAVESAASSMAEFLQINLDKNKEVTRGSLDLDKLARQIISKEPHVTSQRPSTEPSLVNDRLKDKPEPQPADKVSGPVPSENETLAANRVHLNYPQDASEFFLSTQTPAPAGGEARARKNNTTASTSLIDDNLVVKDGAKDGPKAGIPSSAVLSSANASPPTRGDDTARLSPVLNVDGQDINRHPTTPKQPTSLLKSSFLMSGESGSVENSAMFKAMAQPAQRSLRDPVIKTKDKRRQSVRESSIQRIARKPPTPGSSHRPLPKWAREEIKEAKHGQNNRRISRGSSVISSMKD